MSFCLLFSELETRLRSSQSGSDWLHDWFDKVALNLPWKRYFKSEIKSRKNPRKHLGRSARYLVVISDRKASNEGGVSRRMHSCAVRPDTKGRVLYNVQGTHPTTLSLSLSLSLASIYLSGHGSSDNLVIETIDNVAAGKATDVAWLTKILLTMTMSPLFERSLTDVYATTPAGNEINRRDIIKGSRIPFFSLAGRIIAFLFNIAFLGQLILISNLKNNNIWRNIE